ncbi:MAG TPA: T9SS type A sorting domain-containing protein, partial [Cytophagales bacterium]|nr:T9SS type A sorting domain-containing protein [Cytophagales bacterium]
SITLTATGIGQPVTITKTVVVGAEILSAPNYGGSGATYEWFKNGSPTPIPGATGFSLQLPNAGTINNSYCVVVTLNSCKTGGICANSTYNNARLAEPTEVFGISAYPNPVDRTVNISLLNDASAEVVINVYQQATGIKLKTANTHGSSYSFDTSGWASGLYVIEAITNGDRKTISLVVEH